MYLSYFLLYLLLFFCTYLHIVILSFKLFPNFFFQNISFMVSQCHQFLKKNYYFFFVENLLFDLFPVSVDFHFWTLASLFLRSVYLKTLICILFTVLFSPYTHLTFYFSAHPLTSLPITFLFVLYFVFIFPPFSSLPFLIITNLRSNKCRFGLKINKRGDANYEWKGSCQRMV